MCNRFPPVPPGQLKCTLMVTVFVGIVLTANAASTSSIAKPFGAWSTSSTWNGSSVPSSSNCEDTINIDEHVYVTSQTSLSTCSAVVLIVNDTLRFKSGSKLDLPANSTIIITSNGYIVPEGTGSSNQIIIGSTTVWKASDGVVSGPSLYLPVSLIEFSGEYISNRIELHWETASEVNNSHFNVYMIGDDMTKTLIGTERGKMNSTQLTTYDFTFIPPRGHEWIFELEQVDLNGKTHSIATCSVSNTTDNELLKVYSGSGFISIKTTGDPVFVNSIEIVGPNGNLIQTKNLDHWIGTEGIKIKTDDIGIVFAYIICENKRLVIEKVATW